MMLKIDKRINNEKMILKAKKASQFYRQLNTFKIQNSFDYLIVTIMSIIIYHLELFFKKTSFQKRSYFLLFSLLFRYL